MSKILTFVAGASAAMALSISAALAGPLSPTGAPTDAVPAEADLLVQVQYYGPGGCRPGPGGFWRRWEPGFGWVGCEPPRRGPPPGYYAPPPPPPRAYYYGGCPNRTAIYNMCWGQFGTTAHPGYVACMRNNGCRP